MSKSRQPVVTRQDGRIYIDVATADSDELREHLRSHNIQTNAHDGGFGMTRSGVMDLSDQEVDAVLGEWEVAKD